MLTQKRRERPELRRAGICAHGGAGDRRPALAQRFSRDHRHGQRTHGAALARAHAESLRSRSHSRRHSARVRRAPPRSTKRSNVYQSMRRAAEELVAAGHAPQADRRAVRRLFRFRIQLSAPGRETEFRSLSHFHDSRRAGFGHQSAGGNGALGRRTVFEGRRVPALRSTRIKTLFGEARSRRRWPKTRFGRARSPNRR